MSARPAHVAFICDGNRRWAKAKGKNIEEGYEAGLDIIKRLTDHAINRGIKHVTFWVCSLDNVKRGQVWLALFKKLLKKHMKELCHEVIEKGAKVDFVGRCFKDDPSIRGLLDDIAQRSLHSKKIHVTLAIEYSGRDEIKSAFEKAKASRDNDFSQHFFGPSPDLLIRTGGEKRLSDFLLWQLAYTELYFSDIFFPEFDEEAFDEALADFSQRQRNFGT